MTTRKGTILVVDDEEIMREILETLLTREGYDVHVRKALETAEKTVAAGGLRVVS